jgi:hypothetical protein
MEIGVWKLTGVNFPTHFTFLSADLAKIGDVVLSKSRKQKINNNIGLQKGGVLMTPPF